MRKWGLTEKEIDKLWVKYEKENPAQEGDDTWDSRLIKAQAKKLLRYIEGLRIRTNPNEAGPFMCIPLDVEKYEQLLKEVVE